MPADWKPNIVQGKSYDLHAESGAALFQKVQEALGGWLVRDAAAPSERYGEPVYVRPRLGQGAFRILVTDAYERRCSITGERVLPVLEAAHVRPYSDGGEHEIGNGLLLRSDLHTLFDRGYVTVTPELRLEVSSRIRDEFQNGKDYYALHGIEMRSPARPDDAPRRENLSWHNERVYLG